MGRAALLALFLPSLAMGGPQRDLHVELNPAAHRLNVVDTVRLEADGPRTLRFLLHANFRPATTSPGVTVQELERAPQASDFGLTRERFLPPTVPVKLWEVTVPEKGVSFVLGYEGPLDHPVQPVAGEQARGFAETSGTIGEDGVFLTGAAFWIPWFGGGPFPFKVSVDLPPGWDAVSQGRRVEHVLGQGATRVVWESTEPQTEVVLLAGRYVETSRSAGKVEAFAFLREKDDALAAKYLDATERYLRTYADLLGPYPYPKFALVENFWETGYGFPSFTALGPKVLRLPFLLQSSYPHEILHDWWGNGVYVDPSGGNWSEGLTAYLADHLLQEQSGDASGYRQEALQRYADYVTTGKDFALETFRERHSPASEAVGYGKAMMLFHEVRRVIGDEAFVSGLRRFYTEQRFKEASFDALRRALEAASGRDLKTTFAQALTRTGAPQLAVREATAAQEPDGWHVRGVVAQVQPAYVLDVPLAVTLEGTGTAFEATVHLKRETAAFDLKVPARPVRLDVDPAFDLFRRLDPAEAPPAVSAALGAERVLAVLPASATPALQEAYRTLVQALAPEPGRAEIRSDAEVTAFPADRSVWVLGWENRFVSEVARGLAAYGAEASGAAVTLPELSRPRAGLAAVAVTAAPGEGGRVVAWLAADAPQQLPGLARKLPHYGKYSWLAFEGDEPTNVGKGRWPVLRSPRRRR